MPSVSRAQARLMAAVAHGWHPTGMEGPPVSVAKDFNEADTGRNLKKLPKYAKGRRRITLRDLAE